MELQDCAFPLVKGILSTDDPERVRPSARFYCPFCFVSPPPPKKKTCKKKFHPPQNPILGVGIPTTAKNRFDPRFGAEIVQCLNHLKLKLSKRDFFTKHRAERPCNRRITNGRVVTTPLKGGGVSRSGAGGRNFIFWCVGVCVWSKILLRFFFFLLICFFEKTQLVLGLRAKRAKFLQGVEICSSRG